MTDSVVTLRPMVPEDGEALVELSLASPDAGQIQIAPRYHLDAYQANLALHEDTVGVVAVAEGSGKIVGSGFVSFDELCYEGELRTCAWLHNLQVHPEYRRQGIAGQLAEWRVGCARKRVGQEGVVAASIQKGNTGSFAVAQRWSRQFAGEIRNGAVGMRSRRPRALAGITVRAAEPGDFGLIAEGLNEFYDGWNFYSLHAAASLAEWLAQTPFESPFRQYYVVEDETGQILAGIALAEQYRIVEMQVENLPMVMRLLNRVVKLVPSDGSLRQLSAHKAWFAPGQVQAAQYLWETLRWEWRERGNTLTFRYDPQSPLKNIFKTPPWIPESSFTFAIDGPVPVSEERHIASG